jgi:hypothetical protein
LPCAVAVALRTGRASCQAYLPPAYGIAARLVSSLAQAMLVTASPSSFLHLPAVAALCARRSGRFCPGSAAQSQRRMAHTAAGK